MLTTSMREDFGKQELIDEQYRILSEDTDFIFNNSTYTILSQEKLIGKGGETTIYKAKDNHDMIFAAKIYRKSIEDLSDYEKLNEIRLRLSSGYAQNHMLPLLAYDKQWVYKQSNGELVTTQIEIMPYIETDNIAQCSYKLLRESIIPGIVNAINTLHREGFIHRDIKPMNIYIYNGVAVLGDFGTAGVPRRKNNFAEYMPTKRLRGTPGYMAPEAAMGTPSKESDYFALGCTIATLYRGFHPYIIESESNEKYELSTDKV